MSFGALQGGIYQDNQMPSLSDRAGIDALPQDYVLYDPIAESINATPDNYPMDEVITEPSWSMFEKIKELGVGTFGVVYLVKCLQNSVTPGNPSLESTQVTIQSAVKGSNVKKNGGSFIGAGSGTVPGVTTRAMQK